MGPPEASLDLAESCKAFSGKDIKVYTPKLQETVDATSETHIYQVRLCLPGTNWYLSSQTHPKPIPNMSTVSFVCLGFD